MLVSRLVTGVRGSLAAAFSLLPRDPALNSRRTAWGKAAAAETGGGGAGWQRAEVGTSGMSRGCHNTARFATQAIPAKACVERPVLDVTKAKVDTRTTTVTFSDNTSSAFPFVWLRENCQCSTCFQSDAIARIFLIDDLDVHIQPKEVQVTDGSLRMEWPDGHVSVFTGEWLRRRAFTPDSRAAQRTWCMLEKKLWSSEFEVPRSKYSTVMHNDKALLDWLVVLEKYGVTVVEEAPRRVGAINDFIERLGVLKPTHYGRDYEIVTHVTPNNLAYTGARLGLHTDLPYCEYPPGTTWLHCIRQCIGEGGENDLSDGFYAAEKLKERHPHHFETLVNTPIYFQDRGYALYDFDKITPRTSISLDHLGKICRIHVSSQSRDSLMDLDPEGVIRFYEALKAYNDTLRESGVLVKTKPGDILVIDNTRVLHGRTPFDPSTSEGPRHIHNAYIDLDDLRSKRRILQEKLGIELS